MVGRDLLNVECEGDLIMKLSKVGPSGFTYKMNGSPCGFPWALGEQAADHNVSFIKVTNMIIMSATETFPNRGQDIHCLLMMMISSDD
ncbi:hypothetical protein ACLOJK_013066 [Asimina triloba]